MSRNCLKPFEVISMVDFFQSPSFSEKNEVFTFLNFEAAVASAVFKAMFNKKVPQTFEESCGEEFRTLSRALIYRCIALWLADLVKKRLPEEERWVVQGALLRELEDGSVWNEKAMSTAQGVVGSSVSVVTALENISFSPEYDYFESLIIRFIESLFLWDFISRDSPVKEALFGKHREVISTEFTDLEFYTHPIQSLALDVCNLVKKHIRDNFEFYKRAHVNVLVDKFPTSLWPV